MSAVSPLLSHSSHCMSFCTLTCAICKPTCTSDWLESQLALQFENRSLHNAMHWTAWYMVLWFGPASWAASEYFSWYMVLWFGPASWAASEYFSWYMVLWFGPASWAASEYFSWYMVLWFGPASWAASVLQLVHACTCKRAHFACYDNRVHRALQRKRKKEEEEKMKIKERGA